MRQPFLKMITHAETPDFSSGTSPDTNVSQDGSTEHPVRHYLLPEWRRKQIGWDS
jgi:hypothetical protein